MTQTLRVTFAAFFTLLAIGVPATADTEQLFIDDYDTTVLHVCLRNTSIIDDRTWCIGKAATYCTEGEAGQSSYGVAQCYASELKDWDILLNDTYQKLLTQQEEATTDLREFRADYPDMVEQMRNMQRAWIAYRDEACEWDFLQWGGGTGASASSAACMMRLTAYQYLLLKQWEYE